jgi:hypothetical protein
MPPEILIPILITGLLPAYILIFRFLRKRRAPRSGPGRPPRRRRNLSINYAWEEDRTSRPRYHLIEPADCPQQVLRLPWEIPGRVN